MTPELKKRIHKGILDHFGPKMTYEQKKDYYRILAIIDETLNSFDNFDLFYPGEHEHLRIFKILCEETVNDKKKYGTETIFPIINKGENFNMILKFEKR